MHGDGLWRVGQTQRQGINGCADVGPLGRPTRPPRQLDQELARSCVFARRAQQAAAHDEDEPILHPARRDESARRRARQDLTPILDLERVIVPCGKRREPGIVQR